MEVHVVARRAVRRRLGVGERAEGRARALAHARGEAAGVEHARDVDETALDVRVLVAVALCVGVVGRAAVRMAVRMAVLVAVRVAVRVAIARRLVLERVVVLLGRILVGVLDD